MQNGNDLFFTLLDVLLYCLQAVHGFNGIFLIVGVTLWPNVQMHYSCVAEKTNDQNFDIRWSLNDIFGEVIFKLFRWYDLYLDLTS